MNRYKFKLQRVLDVKNIYREKRRRELQNSMTKLTREENVLKGLSENLDGSQNEMKKKRMKTMTGFELSFYYKYFNYLSALIDVQNKKIAQAKNEVTKRREKLIEATKEKEILEKLKERTWESYSRELKKEEQKLSDEISSNNFFRKNV